MRAAGDGPAGGVTLLVNAANANDGPAKCVVRPATVVDVAYFGEEEVGEGGGEEGGG